MAYKSMDPATESEMEGDMKDRRKIQFSIPSAVPTQLDPKQAELIRRRRPTPATLFRITDRASPEDENVHQFPVSENGALKPKGVNTAIYEPPSLKAVQRMAEAQMQSLDAPQTGDVSTVSDFSDAEDMLATHDVSDSTRSDRLKWQLELEVTNLDISSTPQHLVKVKEDCRQSKERGMNIERNQVTNEEKGKGKE